MERSIYVRLSAGGFCVDVEPAVEGRDYSHASTTAKEARGYAGGLKLTNGWPIVDLTIDGTG